MGTSKVGQGCQKRIESKNETFSNLEEKNSKSFEQI